MFPDNQPTTNTPQEANNKRVFIVIALILLVLIGVVWSVFVLLFSGRNNGLRVDVRVLPTYAKVYINDEEVKGKSVRLAPGTYSVRASARGFENYEGSYIVDRVVRAPVLAITLAPVSEEAKEYVKTNEQLYAEQERLSGRQARQQSEIFFKENPIAQHLPYSNLVYTIGYKRVNPDDPSDQSITIEINAPPGYRNAAIKKIWELGYNPADYIINFKYYTNPFKP